ncbi:START domain-containing protein 10 [Merluccius polli]|uniref:START domain-containing protein 10 n=1 Tax=Merluccius polli TaxID=89951 RepID=A0AA47M3A1_MERPO|nr:START domain-containing protein 10 [Merluccius polli]
MSRGASSLPDDAVFSQFRKSCSSTENWNSKYDKHGMQVWVEVPPATPTPGQESAGKIHMIKCRMTIADVSAATMYDVIHDAPYRSTWDHTMMESYDIARLSANADFGYYAWSCPPPLKNRDVVTLRTWQVTDEDYVIVNFSVKHQKHPPRHAFVRAISILSGYLIKPTGPNSCSFTYLSKADPKGSLPKWVVNRASQILAPKVMKCLHKAGQRYPEWKSENSPDQKPWLFPEQNVLPMMDPAELSLQRADSLENVDESAMVEVEKNGDSS